VSDVETIVALHRSAPSRWMHAKQWLDQTVIEPTRKTRRLPLRWADFQSGEYVHRQAFDETAQKLKDERFVLVHGYPGAGKTSLARYVAYQSLSQDDECEVYCLLVQPDQSLDAEK